MNKLYLCHKPKNSKLIYIGYVILNDVAVKLMEAETIEDVLAYMEKRNFTEYEWRIPKMQKFQLIKVKEW